MVDICKLLSDLRLHFSYLCGTWIRKARCIVYWYICIHTRDWRLFLLAILYIWIIYIKDTSGLQAKIVLGDVKRGS